MTKDGSRKHFETITFRTAARIIVPLISPQNRPTRNLLSKWVLPSQSHPKMQLGPRQNCGSKEFLRYLASRSALRRLVGKQCKSPAQDRGLLTTILRKSFLTCFFCIFQEYFSYLSNLQCAKFLELICKQLLYRSLIKLFPIQTTVLLALNVPRHPRRSCKWASRQKKDWTFFPKERVHNGSACQALIKHFDATIFVRPRCILTCDWDGTTHCLSIVSLYCYYFKLLLKKKHLSSF
jgi:hypothetical protein